MENWPRHTKTGRRSRRRTERGGTVREQGERAARPGPCPSKTKRCGPQCAAASCLAVGLPFAGLAGRLQHTGRTARAEGRAATAERGHVCGGIVFSGGFRVASLRGWVGLWLARLRQRSAEIRRSTALWRRVGWRWCRRCLRHALGLLREGCGGPPVRVGAEHRSEAKPVAARPGWRRLCKADGLKARSAVAWQPTGGTRPKYYLKNGCIA